VQAVLGVDPNIVNPMTADIGEVLDDESFKAIIAAVGTGIQLGLGEPPLFDLAPCRYGRIILAFENTFNDPKARENLIHFFHLYMPPLINEGRVFLVDSENIPQKDFVAQVLDPVSRKLIKVEPDTSGIYIARKQDMFGSE
jgi:DNA gyrase/topoisomerase IV subunit B